MFLYFSPSVKKKKKSQNDISKVLESLADTRVRVFWKKRKEKKKRPRRKQLLRVLASGVAGISVAVVVAAVLSELDIIFASEEWQTLTFSAFLQGQLWFCLAGAADALSFWAPLRFGQFRLVFGVDLVLNICFNKLDKHEISRVSHHKAYCVSGSVEFSLFLIICLGWVVNVDIYIRVSYHKVIMNFSVTDSRCLAQLPCAVTASAHCACLKHAQS